MSNHYPGEKTCYCYTCGKPLHYLGVARHRAMHREKLEHFKIMMTDGTIHTPVWSVQERKEREAMGRQDAK